MICAFENIQNPINYQHLFINLVRKRYRSKNKYGRGLRRDAKLLCCTPLQLRELFPNSDRRPLISALEQQANVQLNQIPALVEPVHAPAEEEIEPELEIQVESGPEVESEPAASCPSGDRSLDSGMQDLSIPQPVSVSVSNTQSFWSPGGMRRENWTRPCVRNCRSILIGDSQEMIPK